MKFASSYSGGKESVLALYRAIKKGHTPVLLITVYNTDTGRSYSHGIDEGLLEKISQALEIPLLIVKTSGEDYAKNFEKALLKAKEMGAEACVFGDIDIEGHLTWCSERCENVGITPMFPLWGEEREHVVMEFIESGFVANISVINTKILSTDYLGQRLTEGVVRSIASCGADSCGENGEYHTLVSDGPIFKYKVDFKYGEQLVEDDYAFLPLKACVSNSHRFFNNRDCKYFPCHKDENNPHDSQQGNHWYMNCLFCYCPLYSIGEECGGKFAFNDEGVKCCKNCYFPHKPESYDVIVEKLMKRRC